MEGVKKRMDADAPLGFLLSGGLDSSLVCAIAAKMTDKPIRTFAIGMDKDAIEKKAIEMMEDIGYVDNTDAIDVIEIAKKLGFEVGNAVLKDDVDGFILVEEGKSELLGIKTDKLIGVNSTRNLAWKRFIIAHEIAHYVLQYSKVNNNGMFAHRDHRKGKDE